MQDFKLKKKSMREIDWEKKMKQTIVCQWAELTIYLKGKLLIRITGFEGETLQSLVLEVRNTETKTQRGGKDQELAFQSDGSACILVVKIHQ